MEVLMHRQRVVQTAPLIERLDQESQRIREEAKKLPPVGAHRAAAQGTAGRHRRQYHPMDFITWIEAAGIIFAAQARVFTL
jgi:hypothetical protein